MLKYKRLYISDDVKKDDENFYNRILVAYNY